MEGLFDDLNALKLSQDYADTVGVKRILATVPVGKPNKQDFVRVHPDPDFRLSPAALIELKDDRETYIVTPTMAANLPGEFVPCTLFLAINRQGVLRVWPVKLPGSDGKINPWHHSAAEAAERAMSCWVRLTSNMSLGAYEIFEATGNLPEPKWPEEHSFQEILQIAFPRSCRRQPGPSARSEAARTDMKLPFKEVWLVDFEFGAPPGDIQEPVCLVAWELNSGRKMRLWRDEFGATPPYSTATDALFVVYYASAEIGCHLALGWPVPERVLDLYVEFRNHTNGLPTVCGAGLLGALAQYGLDGIGAGEKDEMRDLILRGGPWTETERADILTYCESDVASLARLLPAMLPKIDLPRALLRGRYMVAVARMEYAGVPIDVPTLNLLQQNWTNIQDELIASIDAGYGVFDRRTFKGDRWARWLANNGIAWPRLESGRLDMSDDTFRQMARSNPLVAPIRELRSSLSEMRLADLAVGRDGRNRILLSPFRARSGRNQPSNSKFIFGPSVWLRGLIQPPPGHGVAYIDWEQQEFGIAAALSDDANMKAAYFSGDPYLAFAKQADAAPPDATKAMHKSVREQFKQCVLAVQFGMGEESLAHRIGQPPIQARQLLRLHRETYRTYWNWSDAACDFAMTRGYLPTVFGWYIHVGSDSNPRMLRNFPMHATGAEMLRLACCLGTERGVEICAPVHDAVLICAPLDRLEADVARMQEAMREASHIVLDGFELGTDADVIVHPNRFADERGAVMWTRVMALISEGGG